MAGILTVDTIQSDSSYASTLNVASKVNFTSGMQIGGQDTTFGGMRNRIINGAMAIHQRGGTITASGLTNTYGLDRWQVRTTAGSANVSMQQSSTAPAGFTNSLLLTVTTADASLASDDLTALVQKIEGHNVSDLGWGTANAQPITISFRVRSSLVGTYGVGVQNNDSNRSYPSTFTINAADTWETKSVTIPGDTTGTWNLGTTSTALYVFFSLAAGSGISGPANAWIAADDRGTTGQVNWGATLSNTFYITGVQLEKGSSATAFEYRQFGQELALCQRYYYVVVNQAPIGSSVEYATVAFYNASELDGFITFPVSMRTAPTLTQTSGTGYHSVDKAGTALTFSAWNGSARAGPNSALLYLSGLSGWTAGYGSFVLTNNNSAYIAVQAEL